MDQGSELVAQIIPTAQFSRPGIINVLPKDTTSLAMLPRSASHLRTDILLFATACSLLRTDQNSATAGTRIAGRARAAR
jgi:hypothetical protein